MKKKPCKNGKGWTVHARGKSPVQRPNKVAVHYQRKPKVHNNVDLLRLAVYGTTDVLATRQGLFSIGKRIMKEHPVDKGYFKMVYVLSKYGKRVVERRRKENGRRIN